MWCLSETAKDLQRDHSLLSRVPSSNARYYLAFLQSLNGQQRSAATRALVRRYHPSALALSGDTLTSEDTYWIARFTESGSAAASAYTTRIADPGHLSAVTDRDELDRPKLIKEVLGSVERQCRATPEALKNGVTRLSETHGRLTLVTAIDFGGRRPFSYLQRVVDDGGSELGGATSVLQWVGISTATSFNLIRNEKIQQAAQTFADILNYFSSAFEILARAAQS